VQETAHGHFVTDSTDEKEEMTTKPDTQREEEEKEVYERV
jgi:hypothetical protein